MVASIAAGIGLKVAFPQQNSDRLSGLLVSDSDVNSIMGGDDMRQVESGKGATKHSSWVSTTPQICLATLYPGMDSTYQDSGMQELSWTVIQKRGGPNRAGESNNRFADQDIAVFPPNSDRAAAFVARSADQWKQCARQVATATYLSDNRSYRWDVGDFSGGSTKIFQRFTEVDGNGYACQRVLNAVSDYVIDVKACGPGVTDEASRIVDKIAAGLAQPGVMK